jgi:hypothetical protein
MKMNKNKTNVLFGALAAMSIILTACGPVNVTSDSTGGSQTSTSSSGDSTGTSAKNQVDHIKIVEGSIATKYIINAPVDYEGLKVTLYASDGKVIGNQVSYSKNKSLFTLGTIDTSTAGTRVFTVDLLLNGVNHFQDSVNYSVSNEYDPVITKIKITSGVDSVYYSDSTIDYSLIKISLLNAEDYALESINATSAKIVRTDIDLTKTSVTKTFTVKYTLTGGTVAQDSKDYYVRATEERNKPTGWTIGGAYKLYKDQYIKVLETPIKDGSDHSTFMSKAPYYMGNYNSVNLMPVISANTPSGGAYIYTSLHNTQVELYKHGETAKLELGDYFDDVNALTTTGLVNFKNTVVGSYDLVYKYVDPVYHFADLKYEINVVNGYNINNVYDVFAINNNTDYQSNEGADIKIADYKTQHNLPDENFDNVVFQCDVTIKKSDIPANFLWTSTELSNIGGSQDLVGSLKDHSVLLNHPLSVNHPTFNLYGNYFKLSLFAKYTTVDDKVTPDPENFPFVKGDIDGKKPETNVPVESHAQVISGMMDNGYGSLADTNPTTAQAKHKVTANYRFNIYNLATTGNQGVRSDSDYTTSGIIFYKARSTGEVKNCIISSYYLGVIADGNFDPKWNTDNSLNYNYSAIHVINIDSTRLFDCGNCCIFNYQENTINIINCEVRTAGGPLVINQSARYSHDDRIRCANIVSTGGVEIRYGSNVVIDNATIMENWVTGQGGWFKINGAEAIVAQLSLFNPLFNTLGTSFLKTENSQNFMNMLVLNMVASSNTDNQAGGFYGYTKANSLNVIEHEKGRSELEAGIASVATDYGASYQKALYSYDYGNIYAIRSKSSEAPIFKTIKNGVSSFASLYQATSSDPYQLVNTKGYVTSSAADFALDADFAKEVGLFMMYVSGSSQGGDPADTTTYYGTIGNEDSGYSGANCYGLLTSLVAAPKK